VSIACGEDGDDEQNCGRLGGQGQPKSSTQSYLEPATISLGDIDCQVESEHDEEGEERVGGVEMGQLYVQDGKADQSDGEKGSYPTPLSPARGWQKQRCQAIGQIEGAQIKGDGQGSPNQVQPISTAHGRPHQSKQAAR